MEKNLDELLKNFIKDKTNKNAINAIINEIIKGTNVWNNKDLRLIFINKHLTTNYIVRCNFLEQTINLVIIFYSWSSFLPKPTNCVPLNSKTPVSPTNK